MPAPAQRRLGRAQRGLERLPLRVAVAQTEIQHGTHGTGTVGGERAGIELDFTHQIGVDDAHRPARGPLRGEVVDVRYLDAVHIELVFRRTAATDNQVVAITYRREGHPGIAAHDARDVAVAARTLLYLPQPDDLHADGRLRRLSVRLRTHGHDAQRLDILIQLHIHLRSGRRHDVIRSLFRRVPHGRDPERIDAGGNVLQTEHSRRIRHGKQGIRHHRRHPRPDHRLTAHPVYHPPTDIKNVLGHRPDKTQTAPKPYP